jgi:hypothetical protein
MSLKTHKIQFINLQHVTQKTHVNVIRSMFDLTSLPNTVLILLFNWLVVCRNGSARL